MADVVFILYIIVLAAITFFTFSRKYDFVWPMDRFDMWPIYLKMNRYVVI